MYFLHIYSSLPACGPFPVCNGKIIIVIWESLLYPCRDLESIRQTWQGWDKLLSLCNVVSCLQSHWEAFRS